MAGLHLACGRCSGRVEEEVDFTAYSSLVQILWNLLTPGTPGSWHTSNRLCFYYASLGFYCTAQAGAYINARLGLNHTWLQ